MTTEPVWAGITEKRTFLRSAEKWFFGQKWVLTQKKHPKFLKRLIFIWEKATFFFEQLFLVVAGTWLGERRVCFLGPEISVFGRKIQFLPHDPNFGQPTVCSPWRDRSFPTSGAIFDFLFPSYSRFCKKKNLVDASKSLPPPHCEGTVCQ